MVDPVPLHPEGRPSASVVKPPNGGRVIRGRFRRRRTPRPLEMPRLTAQERAFLPAALEVIETPASPALRLTALVLCGLIAGAVTWSCLAEIDLVAVAPGKVVPLGQVKVVQPLETAMIRAIHVEEGDTVRAGQVLVELDPTEAQADLGTLLYNRGQAALDAEVARVLAARDPAAEFHAPSEVDATLAAQNREQAQREIERHLAVVAGLNADLAHKRAAAEANGVQMERARSVLPLLEERYAVLKGLYERQVGARPPVLEAEQAMTERLADIKAAASARQQIGAEMRSLEAKLAETRAAYLAEATDRRTKALQKLAGLDQEITKVRRRESYRQLRAPVDGTVQGVKVHTPGAVVTTADVLMTVVPTGSGIEVEAQVENADIGFVAEGQAVEVKLEPFPFTRYGLVTGRVRRLGRDAAAAGQQGRSTPGAQSGAMPMLPPAAELTYPAKIALAQDWIDVDGRREAIRPGMRVSAEIRTGTRRVIEYLLSPVVKAVKEAGRER